MVVSYFVLVVLDKFFFHLGDKKVVAGRVREWPSYRGGCLSRFDCIFHMDRVSI